MNILHPHQHKKGSYKITTIILVCLSVIAVGLFIGIQNLTNKQDELQLEWASERYDEIALKKAADKENERESLIPERFQDPKYDSLIEPEIKIPVTEKTELIDEVEEAVPVKPAAEKEDEAEEIKETKEDIEDEEKLLDEIEDEEVEEIEEIVEKPEVILSAELESIDGEFTVVRGFESVETNKIQVGDVITTSDNAHVKISFPDGSSTKLGPNAEIKINQIQQSDENSLMHIYLVKGNLTIIVASNDINKKVRFDTSDCSIETFKATFTLSKVDNGDTTVKVMKDPSDHNSVIVSGKFNNSFISQVILYELEQISINKETIRQQSGENQSIDLRKFVVNTDGEEVYNTIFE